MDKCNILIHHLLYLTDNVGTFPIFASASGTRPAIHGQSDHERTGTGAEGSTERGRGRRAWNFSLQSDYPPEAKVVLFARPHLSVAQRRGGMSLYSASGAAVRKEGRKEGRGKAVGRGGRIIFKLPFLPLAALKTSDFGGGKSEAASKLASD